MFKLIKGWELTAKIKSKRELMQRIKEAEENKRKANFRGGDLRRKMSSL